MRLPCRKYEPYFYLCIIVVHITSKVNSHLPLYSAKFSCQWLSDADLFRAALPTDRKQPGNEMIHAQIHKKGIANAFVLH